MKQRRLKMNRVTALIGAALLAFSAQAAAETRIGVVDLRQALFASDDAQAFSQQLQRDFAGDEDKVRQAQEEARKLKDRLEKDGSMMNESERNKVAGEFRRRCRSSTSSSNASMPRLTSANNSSLKMPARKWMWLSKNCWKSMTWT